MGAKHFLEFGPRFLDMSTATGYSGAKCFQKIGPIFLAWLTNGSGSEYVQCVIPWDVQSIRGGNHFPTRNESQASAIHRFHELSMPIEAINSAGLLTPPRPFNPVFLHPHPCVPKLGISIAVLLTLLCADEATVLEHAPLLPAPLVAGVDRVV